MAEPAIPHLGELASLATAVCWVISALAFEAAGERIGSLTLNLLRLSIALVWLCLYGAVVHGTPLPTQANGTEWGWLSASSLVGFVWGDFCLLAAYIHLGPRLSSLVMVSTPIWTAIGGILFFGDRLAPIEAIGITAVVVGIAWAVSERPRGPGKRVNAKGVAYALGGATGQAGGLLLSKQGLAGGLDPFAATQIRVLVGLATFALIVTVTGWWPRIAKAIRDGKAMRPTAIGGTFGPFLGVAMSLIGVHYTAQAGVAATLMALTPILLIPVVWFRGERVGLGGALGALIAVAGASLLFT